MKYLFILIYTSMSVLTQSSFYFLSAHSIYVHHARCYVIRTACCEYFQRTATCPTDAPKVTVEYVARHVVLFHSHHVLVICMFYCRKTSSPTWMLWCLLSVPPHDIVCHCSDRVYCYSCPSDPQTQIYLQLLIIASQHGCSTLKERANTLMVCGNDLVLM